MPLSMTGTGVEEKKECFTGQNPRENRHHEKPVVTQCPDHRFNGLSDFTKGKNFQD